MTSEDPSRIAQRPVGSYRVVGPIGAGGMGEVYLATDSRLDRKVALKFLPPEFTNDPSRLRRFRTEARAASALNHPNILTIYEVGESDGRHFIASEFVEGETLRARLKSGPMSLPEALGIATQVASALAAAHAAGVVHRDIKPENIMLRPDGWVKVVDFGLAKLTESAPADSQAFTDERTAAGIVLGTCHYMSPEQARGIAVDARTDIWSLAAVVYEMVTGRRPYGGPTQSDVIAAILQKELDLEGVPTLLVPILQRGLAKDREIRPTASELISELEALQRGTRPDAPSSVTARRTTPLGIAAALTLALAVAIGLAWWLWNRQEKTARIEVPRVRSVAVLPFVNMSGSAQNDYLSDGISEELIHALTRVPDLKVVSRTSSFAFRGKDLDVREIGKRLGVGAVVEGSIRRAGIRIRVSAQLVDVSNGFQLWSNTVERELTDVFELEDTIASSVADALQARMANKPAVRRKLRDVQAYDLYLKGRQASTGWSRKGLEEAISYFRESIARDPSFAEAYAGLADTYSLLDHRPGLSGIEPEEAYRLATEAARTALRFDPDSAEAHAALGHIFTHQGKFGEAELHLRRAVELNPSSGVARLWYGVMLRTLHRFPAAKEQFLRAREVDPLSKQVSTTAASNLWMAGDFEGAADFARRGVEFAPEYGESWLFLAQAYACLGRYREAEEALRRAETATDRSSLTVPERALVMALSGRKTEALRILERLKEENQDSTPAIVRAWAAVGRLDEAERWLDVLVETRPYYARVNVEMPPIPAFEPLRRDPRYHAVRRRLGLPE